jgi:hypothetical protein
MLYALRVISVLFAALALVPAGAHLFSLFSKMRLGEEAYLASQRAYDGWSLFAIVVIGALLSSLALTIALYRASEPYLLAAVAFLCLVGTQVLFWIFTFPANRATENWTMLPEGWETLRTQWEYSHAGAAILNAAALLLLVLASTKA